MSTQVKAKSHRLFATIETTVTALINEGQNVELAIYNAQIKHDAVASRAVIGHLTRGAARPTKPTQLTQPVVDVQPVIETPKFDILERFDFTGKMVKMAIMNVIPSVLITGEGGLGKSFEVMRQIEKAGMKEDTDYIVVKGFSTAKGLYNILCDNDDKLIIFDDCDSILKDIVAVNLLKGALDSGEKRILTWNSQSFGDERPNRFEFTGSIIFISNLEQSKVDQAVRSRAMCVSLAMTPDEKITRIQSVIEDILPEHDLNAKIEALEFLAEYKNQYAANLNFRTFLQVCEIRANFPTDWKSMALYTFSA